MPVWKRTELIILLAATLVLTVITTTFYETWHAARIDREAELHARAVLESINGLVSSVKDAETGQRGYLLTHETKYLAPYVTASRTIPTEVSRLKTLLSSNPDSDRFFRLIDSKMTELKQTIDLRNSDSFDSALALMKTDRGMLDMEALQSTQHKITAELYRSLSENSSRRRERSTRNGFVNIGGGVVLLGLLVLCTIMIHRSALRREQLIALLREDEKQLRALSTKAQDAEASVRDILESIADGFVSVDRHFAISYVNNAAEVILRRTKQELLNRDLWTEFPEAARPEVSACYQQVLSTKTPQNLELFLSQQNVWWEESIYPAKDGSLSIYFRDVTKRKRLEERGLHTQKLESLGILAGGIAHDFNNLLTAILGGASLLQDELSPDSAAAGHVQIIMNASERAAQLTRQMLAYSGRGRFVVEKLDLSQQIREITQLITASVSRDIELSLRLDDSGVLIEADASQIQQLVMNLVINGAEAIETGPGTVVVSTRVEYLDSEYVRDNMVGDGVIPGRYLLLEVRDTGKGMDETTLSKIFDPFFTTKFTGRGLGLAAVIGIVRGHRGAIKIHSHPGQGTTFKVFLPVAVEQTRTAATPVNSGTLSGDETILVVDDEESVQRLVSTALKRYGYCVLQARNGLEAIEIYKKNHASIALVLLDMTMPVMGGEER